MRQIAVCRTISKPLARLAGRQRRSGGSDHGLQDKSAAVGRAHVAGRIGVLPHLLSNRCWRSTAILKRIQSSKRRRQSNCVEP
jgi:hypothetical protein